MIIVLFNLIIIINNIDKENILYFRLSLTLIYNCIDRIDLFVAQKKMLYNLEEYQFYYRKIKSHL
jgi:hypothetical protein